MTFTTITPGTITKVVRKDFFRYRYFYLFYWALLFVHLMGVWKFHADPVGFFEGDYPGIVLQVIPHLEVYILYILSALVLLEDPVCGTSSFWFTRPISRLEMLLSKAISTFGMLLLPKLVLDAVILMANSLALANVAQSFAEQVLHMGTAMVLVGCLAAFSHNAGRFMLWLVGYFVFMLVATGTAAALTTVLSDAFPLLERVLEVEESASRAFMSWIVVFIGLLCCLWVQYIYRKRMLLAGIGVLLAGVVVGNFWPASFFPLRNRLSKKPVEVNPAEIVAHIKESEHETFFSFMREDANTYINAEITTHGLSPDIAPLYHTERTRFVLRNGKTLPTRTKRGQPQGSFQKESYIRASLKLLYGISGYRFHENNTDAQLFTIESDIYNRHKTDAGILTSRHTVETYRYEPSFRLGIAPGCKWAGGSRFLKVLSRSVSKGSVSIVLLETQHPLLYNCAFREPALDSRFVLIHRGKKQMAFIEDRYYMGSYPVVAGTMGVNLYELVFEEDYINEDWVKGTELVWLDPYYCGSFKKTIVTKNFNMKEFPPFYTPEQITKNDPASDEWDKKIDTILKNAGDRKDQHGEAQQAPEVFRLAEMGTARTAHLFRALKRYDESNNWKAGRMIKSAILRVADESSKEQVLQHLSECPEFAGLVLKYNWQEDARGPLVFGLKSYNSCLNIDMFRACVALQDPSLKEDFLWYLVHHRDPDKIYDAIKLVPGLRVEDSVRLLWQSRRYGTDREVADILPIAIAHGHIDAIPRAVLYLKDRHSGDLRNRILGTLVRYSPAKGTSEQVIAWFEENEGKLKWNRNKSRFELQ